MQRFLVALTFIIISAWSQPPQQQAQTPIVVQVQMPPTPHRDFLGYLQSLGPLIAASVAVGVALMQRHLQKQQLKQNLFDKRYKVYEQMNTFLTTVLNGYIDASAVDNFRVETAHAEFIFDQGVIDFIDLVRGRAHVLAKIQTQIGEHRNADLEKHRGVLDPTRPTEDRANLEVDQAEMMKWMIKQHFQQNTVFHESLNLQGDEHFLARWKAAIDRWMERLPDMMASRYRDS